MKTFAFKASLAACLLAPALAMASASFSDTANLKLTLDGVDSTNVAVSWTDLTAALKGSGIAAQEFQATSLNWKLFKDDHLVAGQSGTFADGIGDSNSGNILINEAGLTSGTYKLRVTGLWSLSGEKSDWRTTVKQHVALGNVSPVPELDTYAMLLAGLGLMGTIALRRNKSDAS
jgi:hypothetical protein